MKKKIIRPPKQKRTRRSPHPMKTGNSTAIRSAPNLSAVLKTFNITNNQLYNKQITPLKPEPPQQPIRWITTGDGEEIPMRAVYYCSPRTFRNRMKLVKTDSFDCCTQQSDFIKLFFQKCRTCYYSCDFSKDDAEENENKQIKLECLQQLLSLLRQPNLARYLNNDCLTSLMHMITINIFRPVCSVPLYETTDYAVDLEWEHIEIAYDLFILLLNNNTFSISQTQIKSCIKNLFSMFRMPDKREQQSIGRCLNEICRRYQDQRSSISAKCSSFMTAAQYDRSTQNSLPVFLEFYLHSIAYLRPKNVHSFTLMHLFPLVMLKEFESFHATHLCILEVFMNSDSSLVDNYLLYLLNHWPITSTSRTTLFLNAVHEIVSKFHQKISVSTTGKLLGRISNTFSDCTADVSQQALFMIMDDGMTNLIMTKGNNMIHTLYIRIVDVSEHHWLPATRNFALDAKAHLKSCIPPIRTLNVSDMREKIKMDQKMIQKNWNEIRKMVKNEKNNAAEHDKGNLSSFHVKPPESVNLKMSSPRRGMPSNHANKPKSKPS